MKKVSCTVQEPVYSGEHFDRLNYYTTRSPKEEENWSCYQCGKDSDSIPLPKQKKRKKKKTKTWYRALRCAVGMPHDSSALFCCFCSFFSFFSMLLHNVIPKKKKKKVFGSYRGMTREGGKKKKIIR